MKIERRSFLFSWLLVAVPATVAGGFHFRNWLAGMNQNRMPWRGVARYKVRDSLSDNWMKTVRKTAPKYFENVSRDNQRWKKMIETMADRFVATKDGCHKFDNKFTGLESIFAPKPNRQEKRNALLKKLWRARS